MVATLDLQPDRALFSDATTGDIKGFRVNNGYLEAVDGGLNSIGVMNALTTGLIAALPASSKFGLYYYATDTGEMWFDNGTSWVLWGPSFNSRCKAYLSAGNQDIISATWTQIALDGVDYDHRNEFDNVINYRFTADEDGEYTVFGRVRYIENLDDSTNIQIVVKKNGVNILFGTIIDIGGVSAPGIIVAGSLNVVATDYLELFTYHTHGANREISSGRGHTFFSVNRIG